MGSLKDSKNFFRQSLSLYTSCLFYMLLDDNIVEIEKPEGMCWPTFAVDKFSGLFILLSVFSITYSTFAYIIYGFLSDF